MKPPEIRRSAVLAITNAILAFSLGGCGGSEDEQATVSTDAAAADGTTYSVLHDHDEAQAAERKFLDAEANRTNSGAQQWFKFVRDMGGFVAADEFVHSQNQELVRAKLTEYGLAFEALGNTQTPSDQTNGQESAQAQAVAPTGVDACFQIFGPSLRGKVFITGERQTVAIDIFGRPASASISMVPGPRKPGGRVLDTCAARIASWGIAGDQAGHLIPAAIGGAPIRANLFPHNGTLNMGHWRQVEAIPRLCSAKRVTVYTVLPLYPNPTTVRPHYLRATINIATSAVIGSTSAMIVAPNQAPSLYTIWAIDNFKQTATLYC